MYTVDEFEAEVAANGGFEALLGMYFNNSNVATFGKGVVFDPATQLDRATGVVTFTMFDLRGYEVISTRKLEYLEGMTFAKIPAERDLIDLRTVRY